MNTSTDKTDPAAPPFENCQYAHCDLPGQCTGESACHHPVPTVDEYLTSGSGYVGKRLVSADFARQLQTRGDRLERSRDALRERLAGRELNLVQALKDIEELGEQADAAEQARERDAKDAERLDSMQLLAEQKREPWATVEDGKAVWSIDITATEVRTFATIREAIDAAMGKGEG